MNWDDLRFVLAMERARTLSSAASQLGVTHTTVARRIRALEERIGTRLFDQRPDGFEPTSAGARLCHAAAKMEEEVLALDRDILGRDMRLNGPLLVTTHDLFVRWFAPVWASFVQRYPEVRLEIASSAKILNLARRDADVAVRLTNGPPENLVGRRIGYVDYALYGATSLVGEGAVPSLSDLPWVGWNQRSGAKLTWKWMKKHAPNAPTAVVVDTTEVFSSLIREGVGVGHLPCIAGDADPGLRRISDPIPGFGMEIWVLTHPDLRNTARIRAFMQHVAEGVGEYKDSLAGRSA